jgi:cytochrome c-type biogenesis protein CcmF
MAGHNAQSTTGGTKIGAKIEIVVGKEKETVVPYVIYNGQDQKYFGAESKLLGTQIEFLGMSIGGMGDGTSAIQIALKNAGGIPLSGKSEALIAEVSVKPFISLVWVGTLMMLTGFVIAILRRKRADVV